MKKILVVLAIFVGLGFSACSKDAVAPQDDYYDRANEAAKESHKGLNKE